MFKKFKENAYWKTATLLLICGGILILFSSLLGKTNFSAGFSAINKTLAPIYIGIICAFLVCPVYNKMVSLVYSKKPNLNLAKVVATVVCLVIVVGFISLLAYFMIPQVIQSCMNLANTLPERAAALSDWLSTHFSRFPQLATWVDNLAHTNTSEIIAWIQKNVIGENAVGIATMVSSGVVSAVKYVINAFVGILIMIYILNYKETLFAIAKKIIAATCTEKKQQSWFEFSEIFNETFVGFIVGRIIDSAIIGVLTYIVLAIVGIPFAPMISLIVGVTNVIPFFGPFIGAIPSFFILMLERPMAALEFLIIILIIQQLDGNVIGPKVVGNAIGIGSFWVLIAVLIVGGLFGFAGMVFGVPVFAVCYRYVNKLTTHSLDAKGKANATVDYYSLDKYGIDAKTMKMKKEDKEK